jgi:hypothetical protein
MHNKNKDQLAIQTSDEAVGEDAKWEEPVDSD